MSDHAVLTARLRAAGCVFAEREAVLIAATFAAGPTRERAVRRRAGGEPLEYVVGAAEFAGVTVAIGPPAFIPRARATAIVDTADRVASGPSPGRALTALDLGCGTGALAAALCRRHPDWTVHASESDPDAVPWAERNGAEFRFTVHAGPWFEPLPRELQGGLDLVVAHLPYVPSDQVALLPRDFRDHEPRHTVDGGPDGLDPLRAVCAACLPWLSSTGVLVTQVGWDQVDPATSIATAAGLAIEPAVAADGGDADEDAVVLVLRPGDVSKTA